MIDASHANSSKQHQKQIEVMRDVGRQMAEGNRCIFGVMVESHLHAGAQKFTPGKDDPAKLAGAEHHRRLHRLGRLAAGARHPGRGGEGAAGARLIRPEQAPRPGSPGSR
jgi:hypothetical protein